MILLATNKRDITTDFVVLELKRRGIPYVRLNTEDIQQWTVVLRNGDPAAFEAHRGRSFSVSSIRAGYYRRPEPPKSPGLADKSADEYVVAEWSSLLRTLWNALEGRWLNSPFAILRAEDKPRQLSVARRVGFKIPRTMITNDPEAANNFAVSGSIIAKPLRHALLEDNDGPGRVIFTHRVSELDAKDDSIRMAPIILQEEITKDFDVRVTVIDSNVYAVAIESQAFADSQVDWRKGINPEVPHRPIQLDDAIAKRCVAVTKELDLRYAAIDLIQDRTGELWFLEANPNGQWAWIEHRTGLPLAKHIVDALLRESDATKLS